MSINDVHLLAGYNSEVARGLMHTDDWRSRMVLLQRQFNLETYGTENPEAGLIYPRPMLQRG